MGNYTLTSVLLCDDVRQEASGKETLIGVYANVIIARALPAVLPKLVYRISAILKQPRPKTFKLKLVAPDGSSLFDLPQSDFPLAPPGAGVNVGAMIQPMEFKSAGEYKLYCGVDDEQPHEILAFEVRGPNTDEERALLG